MITLKRSKSLSRVSLEWDKIAALRERQVSSGKDHSANFVLAPAILKELPKCTALIDIGCGTGWLTSRVAKRAELTVGVDPSKGSIEIARSENAGPKVSYFVDSIERFSASGAKFDAAVSNMAASSAPDLETFLLASRKVLKKHAVFVLTIPHPCFWPMYWGYASNPRFNYLSSFAVEGEFKIRKEASRMITTHFHHSLERYMDAIASSRFRIDAIRELVGRGFPFPRFMLIRAQAI